MLTQVHVVKAMVFLVVMYRCENWAMKIKNLCFQTVVLKTLGSPFDSKEVKSVKTEGNQPE